MRKRIERIMIKMGDNGCALLPTQEVSQGEEEREEEKEREEEEIEDYD